jgi:hypothetical protein
MFSGLHLRRLLVGAALVGLLTACTETTPSGVTIGDGVVSVLYRPCVEQTTIGDMKLYDVTDFSRPPVWSARLTDPAQGKLEIPIAAVVPGYTVDDHLQGALQPDRAYRVDARSNTGVSWEGPTFTPQDLRERQVRESGRYDDVDSWVRRDTRCGRSVGVVVVGAVVSAAVVGGLTIAAMAIRRRRMTSRYSDRGLRDHTR